MAHKHTTHTQLRFVVKYIEHLLHLAFFSLSSNIFRNRIYFAGTKILNELVILPQLFFLAKIFSKIDAPCDRFN